MHKSSVICDLCGFEASMEPFNGNSNYRMPESWATVAAHITVSGTNRKERERIKELIRKRVAPSYNLCPNCTADKEKLERERLAREEEVRKISQITAPPRRVLNLGVEP